MATTVMSRPRSPFNGLVETEARLGEDTLSPAFIKHLEYYYDKAPIEDKAKCLELITSIQLGEEVKKSHLLRPRTAMPALGGVHEPLEDILNPYKSTYSREYVKRPDPEVRAIRPMTSKAFADIHDLNGPIGSTTYNAEYVPAPYPVKTEPIRSGSASGNRKNRPHPSQAFMVWKFPSNKPMTQANEDVTSEKMNQIHKRLCSSTYQNDYIGIPQGFQVKSAYNLPPDWRENIPYTLDSVQRHSYQGLPAGREVRVPTTRYGSNMKKHIPANGTIPTSNPFVDNLKTRTTYDRHYNDTAGPFVRQIRDVGRKLGTEALKNYYNMATGEDKTAVGRLLEAYREPHYRTPTPQYRTPTPQYRTPTPQYRTPTPQYRTPTPQYRTPTPPSRASSRPSPYVPACTSVTDFNTAHVPSPPPATPDFSPHVQFTT